MFSNFTPANDTETSSVREPTAGEVGIVPHRHQALSSPEQLIESLALELSNHLSVINTQATLHENTGDARCVEQMARIAQAAGRSALITRTILALTADPSGSS